MMARMTTNIAANTVAAVSPQARPRWQTLYLGITVFYVATFLLWRLLIATPLYETWGWLKVSEIFGHFAYAPVPLLLLGALLLRRRAATVALLIPLLWFTVEYGAFFIPRAPAVHANSNVPTLRVMTANVMRQIGFHRNIVDDLRPIAEEEQPDFIFLQEAGPRALDHLQPLATTWPYQMAGMGGGEVYLAFASKWPIVVGEVVEDWDGCYCIRMTIDWQGQLVDVLAVHVAVPDFDLDIRNGVPIVRHFDTAPQDRIFDAILAEIAASDRPIIVAGDFNTNERQPNYARMIDAGMHNAFAATGWGLGLTFPRPSSIVDWLPIALIRIDHVFYNNAWRTERTWIGTLTASDHRYLFADLHLQNSP